MRREFGFTGFGFGTRRTMTSAVAAQEWVNDSGFDNAGAWSGWAIYADPPTRAADEGEGPLEGTLTGTPPNGNYNLTLDVYAVGAPGTDDATITIAGQPFALGGGTLTVGSHIIPIALSGAVGTALSLEDIGGAGVALSTLSLSGPN